MQKPIIVSLSLALFTLAAGLLWDQKDVFLISYWGRQHPEVQRYGLPLNIFCMYLTSNTMWSQLFMDVEQKTPQKKQSVQLHLWLLWVLLFLNKHHYNIEYHCPHLHFHGFVFVFKLAVVIPKKLFWCSSKN